MQRIGSEADARAKMYGAMQLLTARMRAFAQDIEEGRLDPTGVLMDGGRAVVLVRAQAGVLDGLIIPPRYRAARFISAVLHREQGRLYGEPEDEPPPA